MGVRFDGVREGTLMRLYRSLEKDYLSRDDRDVLEAALDLVLSDRRQAISEGFLWRSVTRNARFMIRRAITSARHAAGERPLPDAHHRRVFWRTDDGDEHVDLISNETPEAFALVAETVRELRGFADSLGAHGVACLEGLLNGETVAATAAAAGVSIPTVERCWRKIRAEAHALLAVTA